MRNRLALSFLAMIVAVATSCVQDFNEDGTTSQPRNTLADKLVGGTDGEAAPGSLLLKLDQAAVRMMEDGQASDVIGELFGDMQVSITKAIPVRFGNPEAASRHGLDRWYKVEFDCDIRLNALASRVAESPKVSAIQYNRYVTHVASVEAYPLEVEPVTKSGTDSGYPFDDPYAHLQWNLYNDGSIHSEAVAGADAGVKDAWRLCAGDPSVVVAIFDMGLNTIHEDLRKALWVNDGEVRGNGKDDDGNGFIDDYYGFNFYDCTTLEDNTVKMIREGVDHTKGSGHGTHVAGIIGAINNNGKGVSSIAGGTGNDDGVRLMSCQTFYGQDGGAKCTDAEIALAFTYAADNGACIAQCSWGHTSEILREDEAYIETAPLEYAALLYFLDPENSNHKALKGNIAVFSAGNQNYPYSIYPGSFENVISVTALDCRYLPAGYSNHGPGCKIAAPGGEWLGVQGDYTTMILSTGKGTESPGTPSISGLNHQYVFMYGTSMACPHISGVLALGIAYADRLGKTFTREQMTSMLLTSTDDIDHLMTGTKKFYESTTTYTDLPLEQYKGQMGTGAVNAWRFLMAIEGTPSVMVEVGEKTSIDLSRYCSPSATYSIDIDEASSTSLGLTGAPVIKDGFLEVECTKVGAGKITLSSSVGKDPEKEDGIGGMSYSREISIISRPFATQNGGWL